MEWNSSPGQPPRRKLAWRWKRWSRLPAPVRPKNAGRQQMTAAAGKTVKLLLADDNPLMRDLVSKSLEPFCEVVIAADGADALLKVIDDPPDVILCDYKMPGLDGRQL